MTIADLDTVVTGGGVEGLPTARALAVAGYLVAPLERHEVLGSFAQDAEAR